ncbi:charged multivesicular body protein 6 [Cryptococcus bacillisporus CA1873]|uniref:Charged multivesicular body protein 6 n=2 Tax=Cryptococcus gattii TaxID=552467 RepID=A0A0D0VRQ2_CRYGA|nr:charged multivesicular body protein 6 [Cryptococcus bacillisporus CA1280]KIR68636.1 charged multivesicular body protein 6 [Cryptococcus bacillisporus CA1873]|eukprot:KIR68636.1 charged multivesicular body protein 6 [Cryptococcus gattii CA1873]
MGIWQNTLVRLGVAQAGPKITTQDRAILDLKLQRDKLKQYQKRLQVILDREHEIAKEALKAGNKNRALTALRQHRFSVSTIEFTQIQNTVLHGLEMGSHVLGELQKEMSLERVDRLMDQTRAGVEYQREIDEALMSKMSPEEEEAVQEELERLQSEALPNVPEVVAPVALPDVPVEEPSVPEPVERNGKSITCLYMDHLRPLVLITSRMQRV